MNPNRDAWGNSPSLLTLVCAPIQNSPTIWWCCLPNVLWPIWAEHVPQVQHQIESLPVCFLSPDLEGKTCDNQYLRNVYDSSMIGAGCTNCGTHFQYGEFIRRNNFTQIFHHVPVGNSFARDCRWQLHGHIELGTWLEIQAVWQIQRHTVWYIFYSLYVHSEFCITSLYSNDQNEK